MTKSSRNAYLRLKVWNNCWKTPNWSKRQLTKWRRLWPADSNSYKRSPKRNSPSEKNCSTSKTSTKANRPKPKGASDIPKSKQFNQNWMNWWLENEGAKISTAPSKNSMGFKRRYWPQLQSAWNQFSNSTPSTRTSGTTAKNMQFSSPSSTISSQHKTKPTSKP